MKLNAIHSNVMQLRRRYNRAWLGVAKKQTKIVVLLLQHNPAFGPLWPWSPLRWGVVRFPNSLGTTQVGQGAWQVGGGGHLDRWRGKKSGNWASLSLSLSLPSAALLPIGLAWAALSSLATGTHHFFSGFQPSSCPPCPPCPPSPTSIQYHYQCGQLPTMPTIPTITITLPMSPIIITIITINDFHYHPTSSICNQIPSTTSTLVCKSEQCPKVRSLQFGDGSVLVCTTRHPFSFFELVKFETSSSTLKVKNLECYHFSNI